MFQEGWFRIAKKYWKIHEEYVIYDRNKIKFRKTRTKSGFGMFKFRANVPLFVRAQVADLTIFSIEIFMVFFNLRSFVILL